MKYSRAALRRGAPRPQNAEANSPRGRQVRASADKTDPRRSIGGQGRPAPRHRRTRQARAAASADKAGPRRSIGGQDRPAPRSAAAAPARPHAYYISPFTLCQAPFFGFIPRALPDLLRPFMAFPCPFAAFFASFSPPRFAARQRGRTNAAGGQNGRGGTGRGQRSKANPEKTAAARNGPRSRERGSAEKTRRRAAPMPFPLPFSPKARAHKRGGRAHIHDSGQTCPKTKENIVWTIVSFFLSALAAANAPPAARRRQRR